MVPHSPIGSCCARPRFNIAGGGDGEYWQRPLLRALAACALRLLGRVIGFARGG